MRKSQRNDSKLSRFAYYKWSGIIVFAPIIVLGILGYVYMVNNEEFFTAWSCETIGEYLNDEDVPSEIPTYDELTISQYSKIESIVNECNDHAKFSEKMTLP